ncbi:PH domain-containing protein [Enterococcus saccharolyticus]|uniref:YdbS-like PH domain-containing protein n=1 Tax=Enterococcus saccharolyticus subsp. saccharolyticus ATCC 43076 TaxID=1139996 RepID=S0NPU1_9ENTE|nr:PH domain-containing protein [Enterococcus saccharolyticus]EOT25596.1 hypothetical protein OMQ_02483 [Enterococcus saccharolyticus subsp. saccharolyticus ATCC 43076]EOT83294.1 hypothetical protein I572_00163 [Enterococcus saccharolyticus subsp. saccharolyticus ATCC 43076]
MSEKHRYHPISWGLAFFQQLKNFVIPIVLLLFQWRELPLGWLIVGLFLLISIIASFQYFTHYYKVTTDSLIVYSGIVNKKETIIPYERMQTLKQQQWFFFKPFHVVRLSIETAGGSSTEAEAVLPAVPERIVQRLEQLRGNHLEEVSETDGYEIPANQILLFSLTNLSMFATFVALFAFFDQLIPDTWSSRLFSLGEQFLQAGWFMFLVAGGSVLLLVSVVSIIKNMILYYRFRVTRQQATITIESGLFERKIQKIPLTKIQGVQIHQQVLRKLFGLVSVEVLLASGQEEGDDMKQVFLLPIIHEQAMYRVLAMLLPEWQLQQPKLHYTSRDKVWYFLRIPLAIMIPLSIGVFFIRPWLSLIALVLGIVWLFISKRNSFYQGYVIEEQRICMQRALFFTKTQTFVARPKIQACQEETSKWLYPKKIYHVCLFIKGDVSVDYLRLKYIEQSDLIKIKNFYQKK